MRRKEQKQAGEETGKFRCDLSQRMLGAISNLVRISAAGAMTFVLSYLLPIHAKIRR